VGAGVLIRLPCRPLTEARKRDDRMPAELALVVLGIHEAISDSRVLLSANSVLPTSGRGKARGAHYAT